MIISINFLVFIFFHFLLSMTVKRFGKYLQSLKFGLVGNSSTGIITFRLELVCMTTRQPTIVPLNHLATVCLHIAYEILMVLYSMKWVHCVCVCMYAKQQQV